MPASNHPGLGSVAANVHAKYATTAKKAPKMIARVLGLIAFAIRLHHSYRGRIYFIPSFSFLIAARPPSKGISRPGSCVLPEEGRIPSESARTEGSVERLPDAGETVGSARTRHRQPRRTRLVPVPQSREPLPEGAIRAVQRPDRGVLPRDNRHLSVPADADHRGANAPDPFLPRRDPLPGVRTAPRHPDRRGTRGPPPDRAHAEAFRTGDRLRGGPPQSRRRRALLGPRVKGRFSRRRHDLGSRPGERIEPRPGGRHRRPGAARAPPAQPESAAGSAPQALSPTKTRSSSRIRYVNPQMSRPSYVNEGTFNSPRIVVTIALP